MHLFYSIYLIVSSVIMYIFDLVAIHNTALHTIILEIGNVFQNLENFYVFNPAGTY